jgi:hypothetical protein
MVERAGRGSTGPANDGMLGKVGLPLSISENQMRVIEAARALH